MQRTTVDIICDQCEKVLFGREGTAERRLTHIRVQGKLAHSVWNEELQQFIYLDLTRYVDKEAAFCNYECLSTYATIREEMALPKVLEAIKLKKAENEERQERRTW